jgi:hypothetical protein
MPLELDYAKVAMILKLKSILFQMYQPQAKKTIKKQAKRSKKHLKSLKHLKSMFRSKNKSKRKIKLRRIGMH